MGSSRPKHYRRLHEDHAAAPPACQKISHHMSKQQDRASYVPHSWEPQLDFQAANFACTTLPLVLEYTCPLRFNLFEIPTPLVRHTKHGCFRGRSSQPKSSGGRWEEMGGTTHPVVLQINRTPQEISETNIFALDIKRHSSCTPTISWFLVRKSGIPYFLLFFCCIMRIYYCYIVLCT